MPLGPSLTQAFYQGRRSADFDPGYTPAPEKTVRLFAIVIGAVFLLCGVFALSSIYIPSAPVDSSLAQAAAVKVGDMVLAQSEGLAVPTLGTLERAASTLSPINGLAGGSTQSQMLSVTRTGHPTAKTALFTVRDVITTVGAYGVQSAPSTQWACLRFGTASYQASGGKCS